MKVSIVKRITILVMAIYTGLALGLFGVAAGTASAQGEGRTVFDRDLTVKAGETVEGDVNITNGDLILEGTIIGDTNVVNGEAFVYGLIEGDLSILTGGKITLYEGSHVTGNIVASGSISLLGNSSVEGSVTSLGGVVTQDPGARVGGSINKIDSPAEAIGNLINPNAASTKNNITNWNQQIGPFARVFGWIGLGVFSALVLMLGVGFAALIPRRVRISGTTLEAQPGPSIVVGIIIALLVPPVFGIVSMVLAVTIVGIVLIPFLALAVMGAFLFGFVIVSEWLGKRIYDGVRNNESPAQPQSQPTTLVIEVLLGGSVILASTVLPAIFLPTWITFMLLGVVYIASSLGIGSAILSRFGTLLPPGSSIRRTSYPSTPVFSASTPSPSHANTMPLGPTPKLPVDQEPR